ncbi:YncE family protein [Alkalicoccus chagannorensis]|uniref:YncE family protein n=1 Tax=Alkalicoccus chagannorensis TaxID=427072 RepID=UPI0003F57CF1|nr:hypothetical protein [Alkalicoccus chagannorensis]
MKYVLFISFVFMLVSGCEDNVSYDWSRETGENLLFVSHLKEDTLTVIDADRMSKAHVLDLPFTVSDMAHLENQNLIILASQEEAELYQLDLDSGELSPVVEVGEGVAELYVDEGGEMLYSAHSQLNKVSQVSLSSWEVVDKVETDDHPLSMDFDDENGNLYVANVYGHSIQVFDVDGLDLLERIEMVDRPNGILLMEDGILAGGHGSYGDLNRLAFYQSFDGTEQVEIETGLMPIDIVRQGERGFVISHGSHEVTALDLSTMEVTGSVEVAHNPYYGILSQSHLIVSSLDGDAVTFIDPENMTIEEQIHVPAGAHAMVVVEGGQ